MKTTTFTSRLGRHGFTLIELLLVISIITVMSSMVLLGVRGVRDDASAAATQMRVSQAKALLQQRMENYEYLKVPVDLSGETRANARRIRNRIIADLINVEVPSNLSAPLTVGAPVFPSQELRDWLNNAVDINGNSFSNRASIIQKLEQRRSSLAYKLEAQLANGQPVTPEESLGWVLSNIEVAGVPGSESMGSRPFVDSQATPGRKIFVDGWSDPFVFQVVYVLPDDPGPDGTFGTGDDVPRPEIPIADAIADTTIVDIEFSNIRLDILSQKLP